jgi:hypothetical protein
MMASGDPLLIRTGRRTRRPIPWLWIVAVTVLLAAAAFFFMVRKPTSGTQARGSVDDQTGDVVGTEAATVAPLLDLHRVTLTRNDDGFVAAFVLANPLDRDAIGDEPVTYELQLRSAGVTYDVLASLSASNLAATATDLARIDAPFVLPAPTVRARGIVITIPTAAVPKLPATFAWGGAVRVRGSEDVAPSDRSALFPPAVQRGSGG